jgi:hypothetical protein
VEVHRAQPEDGRGVGQQIAADTFSSAWHIGTVPVHCKAAFFRDQLGSVSVCCALPSSHSFSVNCKMYSVEFAFLIILSGM